MNDDDDGDLTITCIVFVYQQYHRHHSGESVFSENKKRFYASANKSGLNGLFQCLKEINIFIEASDAHKSANKITRNYCELL